MAPDRAVFRLSKATGASPRNDPILEGQPIELRQVKLDNRLGVVPQTLHVRVVDSTLPSEGRGW